MGRKAWIISVSAIVEMDEGEAQRFGTIWEPENALKEMVLSALAEKSGGQPQTTIKWESLTSIQLDDKPWFGRCEVCNRWVFDAESDEHFGTEQVSRGAKVDSQFRCDEHLPTGHPLCFAGRGYDGPVATPKDLE